VSTFHAYAATTPHSALQPFTFDPGELRPEEVEVKVSYCGICHSDISMLDNDWGMSKFPFVRRKTSLERPFCRLLFDLMHSFLPPRLRRIR
jgi:threonine dehydrogenase-like Zn-dependent dehydrogenase